MTNHLTIRAHWWGATVRVNDRLVRIVLTPHPDPHEIIREELRGMS